MIRHERRLDAERQIGGDFAHGLPDIPAERQNVAAVPHRDGETDAGLAIDAEHRLRRIDEYPPDVGDVAQPQQPPVGRDIDGREVALGIERAGDAKQQRFVAGFQSAGRADGVLRLNCRDQRGAIDAEAGELLGGKLDNDLLVLRAEDFDLGNVGDLQQTGTDVLDVVAQFAMSETVGGEAIDDAEGIAELVVETRTDDARRQSVADVATFLRT